MLAQVYTVTTPGPMTAEMIRFAEDALTQGLAQDGVEANMVLSDPDTGDALVLTLFRDEAALDSFHAYAREKIAEVQAMGGLEIVSNRVYSEVVAVMKPGRFSG